MRQVAAGDRSPAADAVGDSLLEHPAVERFRHAEQLAGTGDHLRARGMLRALVEDESVPVPIRAEARAMYRELGVDRLSIVFGCLAIGAVLLVWAGSLGH